MLISRASLGSVPPGDVEELIDLVRQSFQVSTGPELDDRVK
jgi:hypothetical protein